MRLRFKPTAEQRANLRAELTRLQKPAALLELFASSWPPDLEPSSVHCTVQKVHSDRFVLQVRVRSRTAWQQAYALKVYSDDFGQRVWAYAQALVRYQQPHENGLCLPTRYVPRARTLVFPWVDGLVLSKIVDERKPALLRQAALLAATLHRLPIVPEGPTTMRMIVDDTRARCDRLRHRWPETGSLINSLMAALERVSSLLDPANPAPVHGDMAAGQFLWTGDRLVLLDLDMFGYLDPAYDAGHFLAQLELRCLVNGTPSGQASQWLVAFRDAYLRAMPKVSPRNVSFYRALTLVRKIYTICRREPVDGVKRAPRLAERARAALQEVTSLEAVR